MDMQRLFVFVCVDLRVFESADYQDRELIQSRLKQEDLRILNVLLQ